MDLTVKKAIQKHLLEAIEREELHTRKAAEYLNLNPIYISLAKNEKSWDAMSIKSWERLLEWHESRCPLSQFPIPEGEELFVPKPYQPKPKEKKKPAEKPKVEGKVSLRLSGKDLAEALKEEEHTPEVVFGGERKKAKGEKKEEKKPDDTAGILTLLDRAMNDIAYLKGEIEALKMLVNNLKIDEDGLESNYFVFADETLPSILARLENLERASRPFVTDSPTQINSLTDQPKLKDLMGKAPKYFAFKTEIHIHGK